MKICIKSIKLQTLQNNLGFSLFTVLFVLIKVSKLTTTFKVTRLKGFVILISKSQKIVLLDYMTIKGSFPSV